MQVYQRLNSHRKLKSHGFFEETRGFFFMYGALLNCCFVPTAPYKVLQAGNQAYRMIFLIRIFRMKPELWIWKEAQGVLCQAGSLPSCRFPES
jgi:hypothetical protein